MPSDVVRCIISLCNLQRVHGIIISIHIINKPMITFTLYNEIWKIDVQVK